VPLVVRSAAITGSLDRLGGDGVALGELTARALGARVGERLDVWLPDGTRRDRPLEVVAVLADGFGATAVYAGRDVLAGHVGAAAATSVHVRTADRPALRRVAAARGLALRESAQPRAAADPTDSTNMNRLALGVILAVVLLSVGVSLASTAAIATVARAEELAVLRLAGATPRQVRSVLAVEALVATAVGSRWGSRRLAAASCWRCGRSLGALAGPACRRPVGAPRRRRRREPRRTPSPRPSRRATGAAPAGPHLLIGAA
jgi:putative ABC transport system permease protein